MKKVSLAVLFVMCFLISAVSIKAEELGIFSGWKLSGDATAFASFKAEERTTDSKLNFSYMQFYAEKQIQSDLTVYLSLVVTIKNTTMMQMIMKQPYWLILHFCLMQ